jgi:uncharacterized phage-associated protein
MTLRFNEAKATQAAARLLQLRGGRMHYLKLIKLLYLVDREALLKWGRPVTTDQFVSMDKGPVVSRIYNLIREEPEPGETSIWRMHISEPQNYEVALLRDTPTDELSRAEEDLIAEVFAVYGHRNRWELVRLTHDLPEWRDPEGGSLPIEYSDILRAAHRTPAEIAAFEAELQGLAAAEAWFLPA